MTYRCMKNLLGRAGTIELISSINNPISVNELKNKTKVPSETVNRRISELGGEGLISVESIGNRKIIILTAKGISVKRSIKRILTVTSNLNQEIMPPTIGWVLLTIYGSGEEIKGNTRLQKYLF